MTSWQDILIPVSTSVLKAMEILDKTGLQALVVVNDQRHLLGIITDGDFRRGILTGIPLQDSVARIMNPNPTTVSVDDDAPTILSLMKNKSMHQIPVLDNQNRVVRVEFMGTLLNPEKRENVVVLMAGGLGERLRPLTDDCPKPLLKIGDKPILETIINHFVDFGFEKFYLAVNYKGEMLKDYFDDGSRFGVQIRYVDENKPLGTAGALGLIPDEITRPMIVMNGDLLTKVNFNRLLDSHHDSKAVATMCVREYDFRVPYGVVNMDNGQITSIDEKPVQHFFVNAGIYVLNPECMSLIPKDTYFDMPALFEALAAQKKSVTGFPVREYWLDIGKMDDFEKANGDYVKNFS